MSKDDDYKVARRGQRGQAAILSYSYHCHTSTLSYIRIIYLLMCMFIAII